MLMKFTFTLSVILYSSFFCFCDLNLIDRCFCELNSDVDDCDCPIASLEEFNNHKVYPILKSILSKDYFRYFKVNLQKECPFWVDDSRCALRDCHVKGCTPKEVPRGLQEDDPAYIDHEKSKYYGVSNMVHHPDCLDENHGGLGNLDTSISPEKKESILNWTIFDDQLDNFCEVDDESVNGASYVDLLRNPERFTGYMGHSAHRIWNTIYKENCFEVHRDKLGMNLHSRDSYAFISFSEMLLSFGHDQCLEKRIFYRMVSGLHTSISIHLCKDYLLKDKTKLALGQPIWGPNVTEFITRFDSQIEPDGPQRLKNLFFTYLVEMRAIAKVADYLKNINFFTGDNESDKETKMAIIHFLEEIRKFPKPFNEEKLFQGDPTEAKKLKHQFKKHFRNISRIMDCVGCDKCKLWGKLQVQGMGTALKILFSSHITQTFSPKSSDPFILIGSKFQLTRSEIVSLFNAFGRLSTSVNSLSVFKELLMEKS